MSLDGGLDEVQEFLRAAANATVAFAPESGQRVASRMTDDEGRYQLGTFSVNDGAILGAYRVTIIARGERRPFAIDDSG